MILLKSLINLVDIVDVVTHRYCPITKEMQENQAIFLHVLNELKRLNHHLIN